MKSFSSSFTVIGSEVSSGSVRHLCMAVEMIWKPALSSALEKAASWMTTSAGWTYYGDRPTTQPGEVLLTNDTVHVTSGRYAILNDDQGNPISPPGWWDAVNRVGDQCLVVVVEHGWLSSFDPTVLPDQLQALVDTPHAAQALLPVRS